MIKKESWEEKFIGRQKVARLALVDRHGLPHIVPIVFALYGDRLYTPIDSKPKTIDPRRLQRIRNILVHPQVSVLFDEYEDDWTQLAWVRLDGMATFVEVGVELETGIDLLVERYPQY